MSGPSTGGELVYAIGDVHGCYELMKALLAEIAADWAVHARARRPILVFLGDYVDRGPDSARVVEALVWLSRRTDIELHLLKGNHEDALLRFLDAPVEAAGWLRFGGAETLASYGVEPPGAGDPPERLAAARDALLNRMPAAHLRLLERLELIVGLGDYAFVHAGVRPGVPLASQASRDLLWIRQEFLEVEEAQERVIVHGHTWLDAQPRLLAHRLGLDTGAYETGVLTAARLDGEGQGILQVTRSGPVREARVAGSRTAA